MSRLASAGKMQFYPTSTPDLAHIADRLQGAGKPRLLDPCAGQGDALAVLHDALARTSQPSSYAVELDTDRARRCRQHFPDTTINASWEDVVSSNKAVSLLFLNPPYDYEVVASDKDSDKKQRLEWLFLRSAEDKLQPGGVLVFLVPMLVLANKRTASHLATWYKDIRIYSVVDAEFPKFKQVILFGIKRDRPENGGADIAAMIVAAGTTRPQPIDQAPVAMYTVPDAAIDGKKYTFRNKVTSREDLLTLYAQHGAQTTTAYQHNDHPDKTIQFQPVIQLKTGHVAAMISSGATPVMNLNGDLILRGTSTKVETVKNADGNILEKGRADPNAAKVSEAFVSDLYILKADGTYQILNNKPKAFQALLSEYGAAIHADITSRYQPLYAEPTPAEWAATHLYMHGKRLPGMKKTGLLPMQRHVVAAGARTLRKYKQVIVVAEMGTGKTAMAASMTDMIDAWPALLYVPGHMVAKWQSELPLAVPGAKGFIARTTGDIDRFLADYRPGDKWALIMGYEKAKLGAGPVAIPANRPGARRYHVTDIKDEHGHVVGKNKTLRPCCPKCGNFITLKGGDQAIKCAAVIGKTTDGDGKPQDIRCGEPLYQKSRLRRWPLADYIAKQAKGRFQTLICDEVHKSKGGDTDIGRAFHQLTMATKYTINLTGTLFGGKSTDLFYLLYRLLPEVRREFGFREATKWASIYGRLEHTLIQDDDDSTRHFSGRKKVMAESVKEKPGISPRIYQLLLQTTIFLQIQDLGYKLPPYEEQVVTLDMSPTQQAQYEWLDQTLYEEIVGGLSSFDANAMRMARQLLSVWLTETLYQPNAGFRSRPILWVPPHDRGTAKAHEPWLVDPHESEKYGYTAADDDRDRAAGATPIPLPPGDQRGFIDLGEEWEKRNSQIMHLYPSCRVDELLPKEEWLLQFCLQEKQANRKTIVGVQQTAKRDIQPRLLNILRANGIRAAVLPDELAPEKREAWIAQRAHTIDVLLTNPKKVETGLDLIAFANLIVYELPTSLFTLAQFVRRVWRLGQTQAVRTYYLIYRDTMEHRMLGLVAQKVMAAALLYGDNASTAMSAEAETDDLLAELAKAALNQLPIETGIRAIMAPTMQQDATVEVLDDVDAAELAADFDAEENAADQVEEPTEAAVTIGMSDAAQAAEYTVPWWQQWQNLAQAAKKPAKRSKRVASTTGQMDFFALAMLAAETTPQPAPAPGANYAALLDPGAFAGVQQQALLF